MKIVVFDVDETLGYFTKLGVFWDCLISYLKIGSLNKKDFVALLDIFPEFIRPNIMTILKYVKDQKINNLCGGVMIYTNNQGEKEWIQNIKDYFQEKLNYDLFDKIITAFKINGKRIELCRTTHNKCMKDFIKCTKMSANTELCFIDDMYHPHMSADNVYYIHIKPYKFDVSYEEMMKRVLLSPYFKKYIEDGDDFKAKMLTTFAEFNYVETKKSRKEYEMDRIVGKKILEHLKLFFKDKDNKTHKKCITNINKNKTLKIKRN
jgi:hypothetical protein